MGNKEKNKGEGGARDSYMFRIREYFKDEEKGDHYLLKELGASVMRMGGGVNL